MREVLVTTCRTPRWPQAYSLRHHGEVDVASSVTKVTDILVGEQLRHEISARR